MPSIPDRSRSALARPEAHRRARERARAERIEDTPGQPRHRGREITRRLLADLAPAHATRVTVADEKDGHGTIRTIRPTGRPRARAVEDHPFVTLTTTGTGRCPGGIMWALVVDMDHDDSLLRLYAADVPAPSWIIEKGRNGHVQAGWIIEAVALGPNARPGPIAYAEDVRAALTAAVGGDTAFTNRRHWNPTWPGWETEGRVIWGPTAPRTLGALRAEMIERGTWPSSEAQRARRQRTHPDAVRALLATATSSITVTTGERNQFVFDYARLRPSGTVADAAAEANAMCAPPLPSAEVAGIVRSIERYEARTGCCGRERGTGKVSDTYRAAQAARGRVGGSRSTPAQHAQRVAAARRATTARSRRAAERAQQARRQARNGWTTARIAEHHGVTTRAVRGWLSAPTKQAEKTGASGYPWPSHRTPLARAGALPAPLLPPTMPLRTPATMPPHLPRERIST